LIRSARVAMFPFLFLCFYGVSQAELRVRTPDALRQAVARAQPDYPAIAKQARVAGRVELEFTIEPDGSVGEVRVVSGHELLRPAAIDALKKWKFKPFMEDGAPAKAITTLGFDFKL